jgi:hypothetical protein
MGRMNEERPPDSDPAPPGGGVFANLPDARPGTRSPRRDSARAGGDKPQREPPPKPAPERPRATPPPPPKRPVGDAEPTDAGEPSARQGGGLEDIAWAGVAAAAEAPTIVVRLATRAIEALRGSPEKD